MILTEPKMISVQEADQCLQRNGMDLPTTVVDLTNACGRILREPIVADRDQPPAPRSAMDGIAIAWQSWERGVRSFVVAGVQAAGSPPLKRHAQSDCFEIMTGAVLPEGTDTVIPVEEIKIQNGMAAVGGMTLVRGQFVRSLASEYKRGHMLVRPGVRLTPQHIGVAAAVGCAQLTVTALPDIVVIDTGDELVDVTSRPAVYEVRRSNTFAVQAILSRQGFPHAALMHLCDDRTLLREKLEQTLHKFSVVILSGGVSMGKFDLIPGVLAELGVERLFYKVRQRPGKPFWFGVGTNGTRVFALPGNPVSTQVCVYRYVLPYLLHSSGLLTEAPAYAVLTEEIKANPPLTLFQPVRVHSDRSGRLCACPVNLAGSGDYAGLANADGLLELDENSGPFLQGASYPFIRF